MAFKRACAAPDAYMQETNALHVPNVETLLGPGDHMLMRSVGRVSPLRELCSCSRGHMLIGGAYQARMMGEAHLRMSVPSATTFLAQLRHKMLAFMNLRLAYFLKNSSCSTGATKNAIIFSMHSFMSPTRYPPE